MKTIATKIIKDILRNRLTASKLGRQASNCILLTFDDGPHKKITPAVLERLEDYRARAIFFVVGRRIQNAPFLLNMIKAKGHIIGNHTYTHSIDKQPGVFAYRRDLIKCQKLVESITGTRPTLFRSPGGRISLSSVIAARLVALKTVLWSSASGVWGQRASEEADTIAYQMLKALAPRDIVMLHDDNHKVPKILDIILPVLSSKKIDLYGGVDFLL